jgi:hypothetical protein
MYVFAYSLAMKYGTGKHTSLMGKSPTIMYIYILYIYIDTTAPGGVHVLGYSLKAFE